MSSSLVCITVSIPEANPIPKTMITTPDTAIKMAAVWTVLFTLTSSLAPIYSAVRALTPLASPKRRPVESVTRILVEPTAPRAMGPANFPTTATSDMLKTTCRILENISGTLNTIIFFHREPVHMSIS